MIRLNQLELAVVLWVLAGGGCGTPPPEDEPEPAPLAPAEEAQAIARGEKAYKMACLTCHGVRGDGKGPRAHNLDPLPRDFTRGVYKCRSTVTGVLPLDSDLFMTITIGIPGTSMKGYQDLLSPETRRDIVEYLKTFSPRFKEEKIEPEDIVKIPPEPPSTPESIARGGGIYKAQKCDDCHGERGRGDGPSAHTLRDSWGNHMVAFDFTTGLYRCGSSDSDVYRTFYTGMDGTPMPSYADAVKPEDRWPLVHFVKSLHRKPTVLEKAVLEVPE